MSKISYPNNFFLGAGLTNPRIYFNKLKEIIDAVNLLDSGTITTNDLILADTTDSTSTTTGTLKVAGGVGIVKNLYVGANTVIIGATDSTTSTTGSLKTAGGLGVAKAANIGTTATVGTNLIVSGTTDSTTSTTGAVTNAGGLGVAKAIFAGTTINAGTALTVGTQATVAGGSTQGVGAPGYAFTGATNQGMYNVSATQLGFTNGAAGLNLVVDPTGISTGSVKAQVAIGSTPAPSKVTIVEYTTGRDVLVELTLANFIVGALAGAAAALGIGNIVYSIPAGQHLELVYSLSSIVLTCPGTAVATDTGLGSVIASGAISVLDGTATFEDRLTGVTINTAVDGGAAVSSLATATAGIGTGIALNGTGAVKDIFLNSAGTWNANNTGNLLASGKIYIKYTRV